MTGRAVYLDTSALVKLVLPEAESEALIEFLEDHPIRISSIPSRTELIRAFRRSTAAPAGFGQLQIVLRELNYVDVDEDLVENAGRLAPPSLRSLDALQLASALTVRDEIAAFVAYDKRLQDAALLVGLEVRAPGTGSMA